MHSMDLKSWFAGKKSRLEVTHASQTSHRRLQNGCSSWISFSRSDLDHQIPRNIMQHLRWWQSAALDTSWSLRRCLWETSSKFGDSIGFNRIKVHLECVKVGNSGSLGAAAQQCTLQWQVLQQIGVDCIDESEVLTVADEADLRSSKEYEGIMEQPGTAPLTVTLHFAGRAVLGASHKHT